MERQIIERLAMDAALGELNEDTEALLNAYMAEHPDARQWAEQMSATCTRTQDAIRAKTRRSEAPACPPAAFVRQRMPVRWAGAVRWAAVIVISFLIGMGTGRRPEPSMVAPPTNVAAEMAPSAGHDRSWQEIVREPGNGFWESKAAAMWQSKPYQAAKPQPSLWEAFRQLQKGNNHESSRQ